MPFIVVFIFTHKQQKFRASSTRILLKKSSEHMCADHARRLLGEV